MFDDIAFAVTHVLQSPPRVRFLLSDGLGVPVDLSRFVRRIVRHASKELASIRTVAESIPDDRLRTEALSSIDGKAYHVAGACILATFLSPAAGRHYVEIVAPLETIYDYLDNLCDRHPDVDPSAYPVVHQAIEDALSPAAPPRNYYALGPRGDDGDYLRSLVVRTQRSLRRLAGHEILLPYFRTSARLYAEMQTYKHLPAGERERACVSWFERHRAEFPGLAWQEFVSAAGSQFQVYAPLYALFADRVDEIPRAYASYFPALSALHVLLDAFIDRAEDRAHGELNLVEAYGSHEAFIERAAVLAARAAEGFAALDHPERHRFVLRLMALFYLTHKKVYEQGLDREACMLLRKIDDAMG